MVGVEALGSHGADPSLGICVRLRRAPGSADDLDPLGLEDLVEARRKALVAVETAFRALGHSELLSSATVRS